MKEERKKRNGRKRRRGTEKGPGEITLWKSPAYIYIHRFAIDFRPMRCILC